jgi:hypothetical protein
MLTVTLGELIILHHNVLSAREEREQPAGNFLRLLIHHVVSAVFDDPPSTWTATASIAWRRCRSRNQTATSGVLYISDRALVSQPGTWRKHDRPSSVPGAMESE